MRQNRREDCTPAGVPAVLVTGGTQGIGRAVALKLGSRGARVLITGRSRERAESVLACLHHLNPLAAHAYLPADLSLLSETKRLAEGVLALTPRLDAIVCCAGILSTVPEWTEEGLERNFVLNYLSRHLLARLLLPALCAAPSGRLVLVANAGRYGGALELGDLQYRQGKPGLAVAGRTQFANDLLAVELAERLWGTRIAVTCVFPGVVHTNVFKNARGLSPFVRFMAQMAQRVIAITPEKAAETPAFLALNPHTAGANGRFFGPGLKEIPVPAGVKNSGQRQALWSASEDLVRPWIGANPAWALAGAG